MKKLRFNEVKGIDIDMFPLYGFPTVEQSLLRELESASKQSNLLLNVTDYTLTDENVVIKKLQLNSLSLKKAQMFIMEFCGTSITPHSRDGVNVLEQTFPRPYKQCLFLNKLMRKDMALFVESNMSFLYLKKEKSLVIRCNMKGVRTSAAKTEAEQLRENNFVTIGTQHRGIKKVLACCINQNSGATNNMGNMFIGKPVLSWF